MPDYLTRKAAKFWIAAAGVVTATVVVTWPDAPGWLVTGNAVLVALGVYLVPNDDGGEP